ncbi:SLATT domain-containing protein [Vibrio mangrovi]|uniref:SLATT domain-containing protein n=1 Tax=Vibrio mangrovi TaxID=474394 RepID=A0A1Y6INI6_9VIBR|nr:SLATT domain-containing protein [Vibrio mangrovi]MDW6004005.1 SLATT domain-containing protein [Vibrio mangrovi]SMR99198.1 hypothetical protein VIM7927_00421 [Vibrio mangrovi]
MNKDSIWWTRKSWINAEARLLSFESWSKKFLFWYSLCSVFFSILLLGKEQPEVISKVFVCFSVFSFCSSLFVSLGRFTERANRFKKGYIQLHTLYNKVGNNSYLSDEESDKYRTILESCENHTSLDFMNAKVDAYIHTKDKDSLTIKATSIEIVLYYILKIIKIFISILLICAPLIIYYHLTIQIGAF